LAYAGAALIDCAGMPGSRSFCQISAPVFWSSAMTVESLSPAKSIPSPMPMPRLPLKGRSGRYVHFSAPVAASTAMT
jgi:hypothetical protein